MKLGLMYVGDHISTITEYNEAVLGQRFQCCEEWVMYKMRREEHCEKGQYQVVANWEVESECQHYKRTYTAAVYLEPNPLWSIPCPITVTLIPLIHLLSSRGEQDDVSSGSVS